MEPKTIIITDEQGHDHTFHVLFTHTTQARVSYVFYFDPQDEENVFCSRYNDEGKLFDIQEEEQSIVQDLLQRYQEAEEDDDEEDDEEKSGI